MHIQHIITKSAAIVAAIIIAGCSKHSSPQPEAMTRQNAARMATPEVAAYLTTNSLDVLQARYQEDQTNIEQELAKLDRLHERYKTNDQPYLEEKQKVDQMFSFQRQLANKIEFDKLDAQIRAQGTH